MSGLSAALPPGAPDESLLARMASELFAALPGQSAPAFGSGSGAQAFAPAPTPQAPAVPLPQSAPSSPVTATVPAAPQHGLSLGASSPKLVPHATAQNHVPDVASDAYPVGSPRSAAAQGVPEAYAASLPAVGGAPAFPAGGASAPSSPYYFIGESSALQSAPQAAPGVPHDDRLTAQSFGLPGSDALRALLAEPSHGASPTAAPSPSASPSYYFVEPNAAPTIGHAGRVPNADAGRHPPFDVNAVRRDFPILAERVNGRQLVWFDNAATTQKPQAVIDRLSYFYAHENSNIHRAAHELAARATDAYEAARQKVARFIGAGSVEEVIFVRGATEAINLVAKSWGAKNIREGDEIIVSHLEHHANIVPWQQLAAETGAKIRVIPVDDSGQVLLGEYERLLNEKTKLVAVTQVSNALGTVVPVREIVELAHRAGAKTLIDGAQSVSHMRVDVRALDTDFFVFSGHKIFGPTGIGVVYGKRDILEDMPPWQGGGNMIKDVTFERTIFHPPPGRFEAGTGNIADAVGLGAALDYVGRVGIENIARYEHDLLVYATHAIEGIPGVRLIGTAADKASVLSFVLKGYTTDEVGQALNEEGIAVRTGHHCAQPILRRFGLETTVRPSLAFYNTCEEVDRFAAVVRRLAGQRKS
ncbi:family 2A encapsulin nanocompartment cargo protein cysteine desulfurase [Methyloversatilis sp.]|uniref:family 2A encapsulin nanocompartment cargo protein cysteine desulfurase n=1 Tax=Methyloversatilis sp. TaxID=2569862 RepID=UPI0027B91F46|nr:family 2A encapsulin nanocompartment cargo protein cysteine desulfurase [Methyloversatilis sp.]